MNPRISVSMITAFVLWILATFGPGPAQAATTVEDWSTVKSHYGESFGDRDPGKPLVLGEVKPTLEAIPCPDGRTRTMVELLRLAHDLYPKDKVWADPELRALISADRGWWSELLKWMKDHVKFSIDYFGINIEVFTEDEFGEEVCTQFSWAWNAGIPYLGPCL